VGLAIQFHPHHYPNGPTQIGFISTLLLGMALAWFTHLLECQYPLLNNFEDFIEKLNATFGD
jgi:hypothetical protein